MAISIKRFTDRYGTELALFTVALFLYAARRSPFIGQWDSFDYLKQTVIHKLSDLGLGRPAFIGYNVLLWEAAKCLFGLSPIYVGSVVLAGIIVIGAAGILVFRDFALQLLPARAALMATLGLLLCPMYVVYSGYIMTEVPMLTAAVAAASLLWRQARRQFLLDLGAGILFGIAIGMREQALTLGAAYLWILWVRRGGWRSRLQSALFFSAFSVIIAFGPVLALYFSDPAAFIQRLKTWLDAIPTDQASLPRNVQASLLYTFAVFPGSWLALAAGYVQRRRRGNETTAPADQNRRIPGAYWGLILAFVLPVVVLWRDADVQLHPRYALIIVPAALLLCASRFHSLFPSRKGVLTWAAIHVLVFLLAQVVIEPFRQMQVEKKEFTQLVLNYAPPKALLIPGGYSPVFDYYRGLGERPDWQILWSGWAWNEQSAKAQIEDAWRRNEPVCICDGPAAWLYFEQERLDIFFLVRKCRVKRIAPGLSIVFPPENS